MTATPEDHVLAARLAEETGKILVTLRQSMIEHGAHHFAMKDAGDAAAHRFIADTLAAERPHDALLSEEGADRLERLHADRTWIVDPLDGTREYAEPPRHDWAVHIALVVGGKAVAGAVSLPAEDLIFGTGAPAVVPPMPSERPRVIVSRTRRPPAAQMLAAALDAEYLEMGSAGAKAMAVVRGDADIYAHSGGQYEWDNCAPVAVAEASGLHCSRLDGSPMIYNNPDPYLPDLLICRKELADRCLEILRG